MYKNRSKCNWHEHGEKSTKFFLSLVKRREIQSQIRSFIINQDEITYKAAINKQIFFYQFLFLRKAQVEADKIEAYLENIPLLKTHS